MPHAFAVSRLRKDRLPHLVVAGTAWGLILAAGLTAMDPARCGAVCIDQTAVIAVLSVAVGFVGISPFAVLRFRR
jgi:hypothetical protein